MVSLPIGRQVISSQGGRDSISLSDSERYWWLDLLENWLHPTPKTYCLYCLLPIAYSRIPAIFAAMLFQEPYPNNLPLAPEGSRMINFFIDLIISAAFALVIMKLFVFPIAEPSYIILAYFIPISIFTGIRLIYYFVFETFLGGTIGQRFTKSRIVTIDKEYPSVQQFIIRAISRPITGAGSFISDDIQSFHDKNSGTYVISKEDADLSDL